MLPIDKFEQAIKEFGVNAAMEYFATPDDTKEIIIKAISESTTPASADKSDSHWQRRCEGLAEVLRKFCDCPEVIIEHPEIILNSGKEPISNETMTWAKAVIEKDKQSLIQSSPELENPKP